MPRDRMQHTTALPRDKNCSAYAANAIVSTWKKNFLQIFFRLQKLWNKTGELCLIFFSNRLIPFWNPLLSSYAARLPLKGPTICRSNLRLRSIEQHVAAEPMQCSHILAAWHDFCCPALPRCAVRYNVDVPLVQKDEVRKWGEWYVEQLVG